MGPFLRRHALAIAALGVMAVALLAGSRLSSPTYDEPNHLVRGLAYWWTGSATMSIAHPPLGNALLAAPAAILGPEVDLSALEGYAQRNVGTLATAYFAQDYDSARATLMIARDAMAMLTLGLGAMLYAFCWRRFGAGCARVAVVLFATAPPLLAHGRFMTTDLPVTFALFALAVATVRYLERPGLGELIIVALAAAAAALTKYTGLVGFGVLGVAAAVWAAMGWGRFAGRRRWLRLVVDGVVVAGVFLLAAGGIYRFEKTGMTAQELLDEPVHQDLADNGRRFLERRTALDELPPSTRIPVPHAFIVGLTKTRETSRRGRKTYFLGQWREGGAIGFFPTLLATQLTVPIVVGFFGAIVLLGAMLRRWRWSRDSPSPRSTALVVLTLLFATLMAGAVTSKMNIGLRHALPVIPVVIVFAAIAMDRLLVDGPGPQRLRTGAVVLALLWSTASAAVAFPRYLGFYNAFAGGRRLGHGISLIGEDWGQDVIDLARAAGQEGWEPLYYHPRVPSLRDRELRHFGIKPRGLGCTRPVPGRGYVAVHARIHISGHCFPALAERTPIRIINDHIYVFEMTR